MKYLVKLFCFICVALPFASVASVNSHHAMNVFKGTYLFNDPNTGNNIYRFHLHGK